MKCHGDPACVWPVVWIDPATRQALCAFHAREQNEPASVWRQPTSVESGARAAVLHSARKATAA